MIWMLFVFVGVPIPQPVDVWANCVVVHVEFIDRLNEYPQVIDKVKVIEFCRTRDGLELRERDALWYDGRVAKRPSGITTTTLWEQKRAPLPKQTPIADILREMVAP